MRVAWKLARLLRSGLLAATVTTGAAQPAHRPLVLVARAEDPRAIQQRAALERDVASLRARDVVVQVITPEVARRERPELGAGARAFAVLLVGKDGQVK